MTECAVGEDAEIVDVPDDTALAARLRELGMVPGAWVRMARQGPPVIVRLGDTRLCLRGEEAANVTVRVHSSYPCTEPIWCAAPSLDEEAVAAGSALPTGS